MHSQTRRVFLSYTGKDLGEFADAAGRVLTRFQWAIVDHRHWAPNGRRSVAECKRQLESCDIVVVIVAHRYGWRPGQEQGCDGSISITEMEYKWARALEKPVVPFLIKDDAEWDAALIEANENKAALEPLNRFKDELRGYVCAFFTQDVSKFEALLPFGLWAADAQLQAGAEVYNAFGRPLRRPVGVVAERDHMLPYLCDRSAQSRHAHRTLFEHIKTGRTRPMLYVVHGHAGQAHHAFVERMHHVMLPRVVDDVPGGREIRKAHLSRIEPSNYTTFAGEFRADLANKLRRPALESDAAVLTWLQSSKVRGIHVVFELRASMCRDAKATLQAIHEYLQKFPDIPAPFFLIVVVCVKYDTKPQTWMQSVRSVFSKAPDAGERMRAAVRALDMNGRGDIKAPVYALPELESITITDLDEWIGDLQESHPGKHIPESDREKFFGGDQHLPMDVAIKQLQQLLEPMEKA